jgi:tripartite-type tricarboxylate transporter receptor subunit TctC
MKRIFIAAIASVAAVLSQAVAVEAQDRTIKLIVPSSAGGVHDVIGRLWADGLKQSLGTIVIDNRGGGGGSIGVGEAQRATPDGTTLLLGSNSSQILQPVVFKASGKSLSYDPIDDFEIVSVFALTSTAIAVTPNLPVKSLKELIDLLRANPDKYNYAHGGVGTISNVSAELFKQLAGNLKVRPVSYRGMGPAQADIINGTLEFFLPNVTGQVAALHDTGKIRVLSVNAPGPHGSLPGIPTSIAAGLPDMIAQSFFAILAPKGTVRAEVDRVNAATRAAVSDKSFQARLAAAGFEPLEGLDPVQSRAYMKKEHVRWEGIVKAANIKE